MNVVGKRDIFRIETASKSCWPELENELFNWFKEKRQKGACGKSKLNGRYSLILCFEWLV